MGRPPVRRDRKRRPPADFWPTTSDKYDGSIVELNRMSRPECLAARRFSKKIPKILLGLMHCNDFGLQDGAQSFDYR
jgi:hypothetical protein